MGEGKQSRFLQGIEAHDLRPALGGPLQFGQHARVIGPRILAEDEDGVGFLEILKRDRPLAGSDRLAHADTARFMAHVRAVGKVVGSVEASEQLVKERRLVAGAAGGVEDRLVGRVEAPQLLCDPREGLLPGDPDVVIRLGIVGHRLGQASGVLKREVVPTPHLGDRVPRKERGIRPLVRGLVGECLDAVLAEFSHRVVLRIGPCASGAVEAARFIHAQEGRVPLKESLPAEEMHRGVERPPASSRVLRFRHDVSFYVVSQPVGSSVIDRRTL